MPETTLNYLEEDNRIVSLDIVLVREPEVAQVQPILQRQQQVALPILEIEDLMDFLANNDDEKIIIINNPPLNQQELQRTNGDSQLGENLTNLDL